MTKPAPVLLVADRMDITERKRAEQLLKLEHTVARGLAEANETAGALRNVIQAVCETQDWDYGRYWQLDETRGVLCNGAFWSVPRRVLTDHLEATAAFVMKPGDGLVGRVWMSGEPLWVPDVDNDASVLQKELVHKTGLHGSFVFPVVADAKIIGVLAFVSREIREPDARFLAAAEVIGSQLGQFLQRKRTEEALRRFRVALDNSADMILLIDRATMRYVDMNETVCRLLGYSREEMLGMGPQDVLPASREELERSYDELIANPSMAGSMRSHYLCKDGSTLPFESTRHVLRSGNGYLIAAISRDIRERLTAEQNLRESEARFKSLTELSSDWYWEQDEEYCFVGVGIADGQRQVWPGDSVGKTRWDNPGASLGEEEWAAHRAVLDARQPFTDFEYSRLGGNGERRWISISGAPILDVEGRFTGYRGVGRDTTERKHAEEKLAYLAQFDVLTDLPNRNLFHDRLAQTLSHAQRVGGLTGVLFIDLDRFKIVNDTLGHGAGDTLLKMVANRLQACIRSGDTVSRLGGDEFAIVLSNLARADDAGLVAQKIVASCARAFDLEGQESYISASIGIALSPDDGTNPEALLKSADIAMYRAKEQGRNGYQFYLPEMHRRAIDRMQMEAELRGALERSEFVLHYQPKADLHNGTISGFEALLRWQHPTRGLVQPLQFIATLEDTGLILPVGEWIVRTVCAQIRRWQEMRMSPRPVAVNLSARQFQQKDLDTVIGTILKETGVDPRLLEFELTESLLMKDAEEAVRVLHNLKAYGVRLSVDDFGTGYSSLAYLKRFPLDSLKIDRAFIRDCTSDADDATIALAIISLAHSLKLKVVAEGVETEAQLNFLRARGCDQMQGFYFARPLDTAGATDALMRDMRLPRSGADAAAQTICVLLIDDNADYLEIFRDTLARDGYRVLTATHGQTGLDFMAAQTVEIVISDQNMPVASGVDFLTAVRNLYPGAIRVMLTGNANPDSLPAAVNEAGIHRYLSKHWDAERVCLELREACKLALKHRATDD